jgi:hypothetical protein
MKTNNIRTFPRTSFRTYQTRQNSLCSNSLATLLLSHLHQPECGILSLAYFEYYVNTVVNVHISNTENEDK